MAFGLTAEINTQLNQASLSKIKSDLQNSINSINGKINITANSSSLDALNARLKDLKNTSFQADKIMRDLDVSVGRIDQSFSRSANGVLKFGSAMKQNASDLTNVFKSATTSLEAFSEQSALAARRFIAFSVAYQGIGGLAGLLKNAVVQSIEFDRELVRIGQVSEDSFQKVRDLGKEVGRLAVNLGVNSNELIKSAVLLKQAGLSVDDTSTALQALAKAALAPNFDSLADTTNGLIAVMQQFNIKAKDFESVLGSMNAVAGAFAVEAADLTTVVQKTGGVFASIKGDTKTGRDALNELLAVFTSIRSTTRESAEEISTGLRTIFGRLQRSETVEALKNLGVELRFTKKEVESLGLDNALEGQFVGGFEAVKRISQELSKIPSTDARFAAITEQIGGLRQLSRVTPLIQQFSKSTEALAVAQAGASSLAINAGQAQESLANKINKVKESWLDLGRVLTDDSGFKSTVNNVSLLSDGLVAVLRNLGPLIPVLTAFAGFKAVSTFLPAIGKSLFDRDQYPGARDDLKRLREGKTDPRDRFLKFSQDVTPLSQLKNLPVPQQIEVNKSIESSLRKTIEESFPNATKSEKDFRLQTELERVSKVDKLQSKLENKAENLETSSFKSQQREAQLRAVRESAESKISNLEKTGIDREEAIQLLNKTKADLENTVSKTSPLIDRKAENFLESKLEASKPKNQLKALLDNNAAEVASIEAERKAARADAINRGNTRNDGVNQLGKDKIQDLNIKKSASSKLASDTDNLLKSKLAELEELRGPNSITGAGKFRDLKAYKALSTPIIKEIEELKLKKEAIAKENALIDQTIAKTEAEIKTVTAKAKGVLTTTLKDIDKTYSDKIKTVNDRDFGAKFVNLNEAVKSGRGDIPADTKSAQRLQKIKDDAAKNLTEAQKKAAKDLEDSRREAEYLANPTAFLGQEKQAKVETELAAARAAKAKTTAQAIDDRLQVVTTTDALGNKTSTLPATEDRIKQKAAQQAPVTGNQTLAGFALEQAQASIAKKKIISEELKQLEFIRIENQVREAYIKAATLQIIAANAGIKSSEAKIIAEERHAKILNDNSAVLSTKDFKRSGLISDTTLGVDATPTDVRKQAIKDFFTQDKATKLAFAGPIIAGGISSRVGTANENVLSGTSGAFEGTNAVSGAVGGAALASLVGAGPVGVVGAALAGFAFSLADAQKQIADAKLGAEVQKLADKFRQINDNILQLDDKTAKEINDSQEELKKQIASSATFNNPLSAIGDASRNTFNSSKFEAIPSNFASLSNRVSPPLALLANLFTNKDTIPKEIEEKTRAELSKNSAQTIQILNREIERVVKSVGQRAGETDKEFSKRVLEQIKSANNGFFGKQLNNQAFSERVGLDKITNRALAQIGSQIQDRKGAGATEGVTRTVNNFNLLADSIIAASQEMKRFSEIAADITNILNGKIDVVRASSLADTVRSGSSFNSVAFGKVLQSVGGALGPKGSGIIQQGDVISATKQLLPVILATVRSSGNLSDGQGGFGGSVTTLLTKQLKDRSFNDNQINTVVSTIVSSLSNQDINKTFTESGSDVSKVSEKLLEPLFKPFADLLVTVRKEMENSTNSFIQQLNAVSIAFSKLNDDLSLVDRNKAGLAQLNAEIAQRTTGKLATDILPLPNLADKAVARLAPGFDNNPEKIGNKIRENVTKLQAAQDQIDKALNSGFGGAVGNTVKEFQRLQNETNNLSLAQKLLADASNKQAEIQNKLNSLKEQEASQINQFKIITAGSPEERRNLRKGRAAFEKIEGGANIQDLSRRERGLLFQFQNQAGPREKAVIDAQIRKEGGDVVPGFQDVQAEIIKAQQQLVEAQERSIKASEEVAKTTSLLTAMLQNNVINSQNALTIAIQRNTAILELREKTVQLSINAEAQKSIEAPVNALNKIVSPVAGLNIDPRKAIENRALISSFAGLKARKNTEDFFAFENDGTPKNPTGRAEIQKIVDSAKGNDFLQRRGQIVSALVDKFGFDNERAEKIVPRTDTPNLGNKIFGAASVSLDENPLLNRADRAKLIEQEGNLKNKGLGALTTQNPEVLNTLTKNIDTFNNFGKSIEQLQTSSNLLKTEFDVLQRSIADVNSKLSGIPAPPAAPGFSRGGVVPHYFADGGFAPLMGIGQGMANFKPKGTDTVPAMLTPGEVVVPKNKVDKNKNAIRSILSGDPIYMAGGGQVPLRDWLAGKGVPGDIRRAALQEGSLGFFGDLNKSERRNFNIGSGLLSSSSRGRPGIGSQRAIEASLIRQMQIDNRTVIQSNFDEEQAKRQYGLNRIQKFASGGFVGGTGIGDSVSAMLTPGEFVLNKKQVAAIGPQNLAKLATNPTQKPSEAKNADFSDSSNKFLEGAKLFQGSVNDFGKHVESLSEALNKRIQIEGEQDINVNVTGIPAKSADNIVEAVETAVSAQMAKMFPSYT